MKNVLVRWLTLAVSVVFAGLAFAGEGKPGRRADTALDSNCLPALHRPGAVVPQGSAEKNLPPLPAPLLEKDRPVQWWFVFKLNAGKFPGCGADSQRACLFGGTVQDYPKFGQQFVFSSSESPALKQGSDCLGNTLKDPVGATFEAIYRGGFNFVIWSDQFYRDPKIKGCGDSCDAPWGHSKGMVAWNDAGDGVVLQVTTPSWPGAGNASAPRTDGNTLGCVGSDNNVKFSQHFFALRLTRSDLIQVLRALKNASVVTDPANPQIVHNGGPTEIRSLVAQLGRKSDATSPLVAKLSTGVALISKPSALTVPPWQLVSATLDGTPLRAATWWADPHHLRFDADRLLERYPRQIRPGPDRHHWKVGGDLVQPERGTQSGRKPRQDRRVDRHRPPLCHLR